MNIRKIPLNSIELEEQFRHTVEDKRITVNIKENELQEPLTVEGPTVDNKFILVKGYRRYASIRSLGFTEVQCKVEKLTNKETRIFKRLNSDVHNKRKTGFEIERMIEPLLNKGYDKKQIAKALNIQTQTVTRYIKSLKIEDELKKRAEYAKVGRDGLVRITGLKNTMINLKNKLIEKYINNEILGYHAKSIEKADKNPYFKNLPESYQEQCIDSIINKINANRNQTDKIIRCYSLKYQYDEDLLDYVYEYICNDIQRLKEDCSRNFIDNLDKDRLEYLNKLLNSILEKSNDTISNPEVKKSKTNRNFKCEAKFIPKQNQ